MLSYLKDKTIHTIFYYQPQDMKIWIRLYYFINKQKLKDYTLNIIIIIIITFHLKLEHICNYAQVLQNKTTIKYQKLILNTPLGFDCIKLMNCF